MIKELKELNDFALVTAIRNAVRAKDTPLSLHWISLCNFSLRESKLLLYACWNNCSPEIAAALLNSGVDPNEKDVSKSNKLKHSSALC